MNMHESFALSETTCSPSAPARSWLGSAFAGFVAWVKRCADHYAAAAVYEELSRLSDAQLKHRGLSRDVLVRDLNAFRDRISVN